MTKRPELKTDRLLLRPFTLADAPVVQRLAGDWDIAVNTLTMPHPYEDGMAEEWIATHQERFERKETVTFAVTLNPDGTLVGAISLMGLDERHQHAELGYWIGKPYWNHSYCTEAADAILGYGFTELGLHRIFGQHFTRNPASGRVMEKIGMTYEGCLRKHVQRWGVFEDLKVYGILRSEYESQTRTRNDDSRRYKDGTYQRNPKVAIETSLSHRQDSSLAGQAPPERRTQMEKQIEPYHPQAIEAKWRQRWAETGIYRTPDPEGRSTFYCLDFFPYPSGDGLSVGHGRNYVPTDVISRYHRMKGDAVLHPMGWDAFGLPAENEAIKKGIHPQQTTARYAANYRRQMTLIGCSYDWEYEINSSTPDFYRWTQWFFLLLYRHGLAYRAVGQQWRCPGCRTVLADEQIESGGICWRCHGPVHKRDLEQWYFRITAYADELLADLETLDWPEHILAIQRHWIGRSEGVEFEMAVDSTDDKFTVYTTRPDTVYGMTFAVLAPEHPLVERITTADRRTEVIAYCQAGARRSEVDRLQASRDGVFTGGYAINPVNATRVPIFVADYVLMSYGGGAIMAVPAHDERDFDFAVRHAIPAPVVIAPPGELPTRPYTGQGVMVNSGPWDGLSSDEAKERITDWMEDQGIGRRTVQYRMRDWLISRQRYWGTPIPIIYCDDCGTVPVPAHDLPVLLPHIEEWLPGEDGRSPLANVPEFVHTTCPQCGSPARRETDTLDGFACSSWYFLRFVSTHYEDGPFDPVALAQWGAPDLYVGGAEHAVMHLLYARFWTKVMADAGIVPFREPFSALRSQGIMHARDPQTGEVRKMGKSEGNVVTPDSVAETHGADALRVYLLFMAPFENNTVWEEKDIIGAKRFLERTWRLINAVASTSEPVKTITYTGLQRAVHRTIRRVTADVKVFKFNTAIAALMECLNEMTAYQQAHGVTTELAESARTFVLLLAPFAPHIAEELWVGLGGSYSVHGQAWPVWDERLIAEETVTLVVQVDGRVRDRLTVPADTVEAEVHDMALACDGVRRHLDGRRVARVIYVPGRLVNVVTEAVEA